MPHNNRNRCIKYSAVHIQLKGFLLFQLSSCMNLSPFASNLAFVSTLKLCHELQQDTFLTLWGHLEHLKGLCIFQQDSFSFSQWQNCSKHNLTQHPMQSTYWCVIFILRFWLIIHCYSCLDPMSQCCTALPLGYQWEY